VYLRKSGSIEETLTYRDVVKVIVAVVLVKSHLTAVSNLKAGRIELIVNVTFQSIEQRRQIREGVLTRPGSTHWKATAVNDTSVELFKEKTPL
jgi:hypothetical protein